MLRTVIGRFGVALVLLALAARIAAGIGVPQPPMPAFFAAICHTGDAPAPVSPVGACPVCPFCTALAGPIVLPSAGFGVPVRNGDLGYAFRAPFVAPVRSQDQNFQPPARGPPHLT